MHKMFLFLLVHNSEFLENLIKNIIVSECILMWSSAEWDETIFMKLSGTWLSCGSYRVYVAVVGSTCLLRVLRRGGGGGALKLFFDGGVPHETLKWGS